MKQSKQLSFQLPLLSDDLVNYYKLHNCKVERNPNRTWTLTVPSQRTRIMKSDNNSFWVQTSTPCSALNGDLCGLHNTDKKPTVCKQLTEDFYSKFFITDNCILIDKPDIDRFDEKKEV